MQTSYALWALGLALLLFAFGCTQPAGEKTGCEWRPTKDYGLCEGILGYYYDGERCGGISGCSPKGDQIPFDSMEECEALCKNNVAPLPLPQPTPTTPTPEPAPLPEPSEEPTTQEGLTQALCEQASGRWNECGSACRGVPPDTMCIQVCVAYCECGTFNSFRCPADYSCQDLIAPQAVITTGICKPIEEGEELEEEPEETGEESEEQWIQEGARIAGTYADAEIIPLPDGKYRMYYATEPEVPNNQLEVFSATSEDGLSWQKEPGVRLTFATFPDVIALPDGRYRIYFQRFSQEYDQQAIHSAISDDGLHFEVEEGVRLVPTSGGLDRDTVAATSVIQLPDGRYRMYYRGTVNEKTDSMNPNPFTTRLFSAISEDGLRFEKEPGVRIETRNDILHEMADGTFILQLEDGNYRLYFGSVDGIYQADSEDGLEFTLHPQPVFTGTFRPGMPSVGGPPGDPTIIQMDDGYRMYFGQHTLGIYSAFLPFASSENDEAQTSED